jgi:hypothetical protein
MKKNFHSPVALILFGAMWVATPLQAKEVFLECVGQSKRCVKVADISRCEATTTEKHVLAVEGKTIKHLNNGGGFLSFKALCDVSDTLLNCVQPIEIGSKETKDAESGFRTLSLNRITGKLDWSYLSTFDPQHTTLKTTGASGWANTYDAQCILRENKTLF